MPGTFVEVGGYELFSATKQITTYPTSMLGLFISSASGTPTITVYDSASGATSTTVVSTFTPTASTFYKLPAGISQGLYIVVSGTVSGTAFFV
jgi:hypothetical protein